MKGLLAILLIVLPAIAWANDAFPTVRRGGLANGDWRNVGVRDGAGRPSVTTVFTTLSPGATVTDINNARNSCPSNQVVMLNAGLYDLAGGEFTVGKDGVVIRGTTNSLGECLTILSNVVIKISKTQWPSLNSWADITGQNISSGLTEGSTSITLSASASAEFEVGDLFVIDQTFDGTSVKDSNADWAHRPDRSLAQVVLCTSKSGATLGFTPPLMHNYWNASQDPEAWGWSSTYGDTLRMAGLEDVDIVKAGAGSQVVTGGPAYNCWMYNVRGTDYPSGGGGSFTRWSYSLNCEIRWCVFHDGPTASSSSYATYPTMVTAFAIEHNIFTNLALAMPNVSAVGCSFSFNYCTGPYPYSPSSWLPEYFFPHGGHSHTLLYEGNWMDGSIYLDAITGGNNNSRIGIVHNRITGWYSGKTGNTTPLTLETDQDDITILSNVLGMEGYHTTYASCYSINASCTGIIRTNNYDVGTDGIASSETLSGSDSVATSYRFTAKPDEWGPLPFPTLGVTTTSTNQTYYTNLPAGFRSWAGRFPSAAAGGGGGAAPQSRRGKRASLSQFVPQ